MTVTRPVPGLDEFILPDGPLAKAEFGKHAWYGPLLASCAARAPQDAMRLFGVQVASDLSAEDSQLLGNVGIRLRAGKSHVYSSQMRSLFPLLYEDPGTGLARMPGVVLASEIVMLGIGTAWPVNLAASARRFAARVGSAHEVYWVDKYLGAPPHLLRMFIDAAARYVAPAELRLLTSRNAFGAAGPASLVKEVGGALAGWRARGIVVQLRVMPPSDEVRLHERQLAFQRRTDGYVLPPFDRVVCRAAPGNASDRYMPVVDVAFLLNAWARGDVLI